jgi:uridine kinase
MTKDRYINPKYEENGRKKHKILPKKVIIVEGYMSFYDKNIRDLYDFKIYLNLPIQESIKRRDKSTCSDDDLYNQIILIPMHEKYVEPTKIYANLQVDVLKNKQNNVYIQVEEQMKKLNIL